MLDMAEKLAEAGVAALPVPPKSTFSDGRLSAKEGLAYARALCVHRGVKPPNSRTFRWHLRQGALPSERRPDPAGKSGDPLYAVAPADVVAFVDRLEEKGGKMRVVDEPQRGGSVVRRKAPRPDEMTKQEAFVYLHKAVGRKRCQLNSTTFGFYVAYGLIPSRWEGKQRMVSQAAIDAFLESAPDGIHANHVRYETAPRIGPGQLSPKDAYAYYASVDPAPVALNTFRSLVAAGIVQAVRMADDPKSPVVGFNKREIDAFLALRHRIVESNSERPATKSFLTRKQQEAESRAEPGIVKKVIEETLARAKPMLDKAQEAATRSGAPTEKKKKKPTGSPAKSAKKKSAKKVPEGRWVPIKEAYAYYVQRCESPFTESWFQKKCYSSDVFGKRVVRDERPNNPTGKKYLIDLDTVDAHVAGAPVSKPRRSPGKAWPIEKAYHKFRELIPPGLTLLQFKRLVNTGLIKSVIRNTVVQVRSDAVERYFAGLEEVSADRALQMGPAYDYYCSRCDDPVAQAHFSRWVTGGKIEGAEKNGEGLWTVTTAKIDAFLDKFPTGRIRPNRNSRVALGGATPPKPSGRLAQMAARAAQDVADERPSMGTVSVSLSSYDSPQEMRKAVALLTSQGFKVDVKP